LRRKPSPACQQIGELRLDAVHCGGAAPLQRGILDCISDAIQDLTARPIEGRYQAAFTVIFFAGFCASALFGIVTVRTPFLKLASILSASTPSGTWNERWKEP
jgi:hypothetical protein